MKKVILSIFCFITGVLLVQAQPTFYGLTFEGGTAGSGTIFKYQGSANTLSAVKNFETIEYYTPGNLLKAADGKFYGMTTYGGSKGNGVVFSYDPASGSYSVLKNFDWTTGAYPYGSLIQGSDSKLYGMTYQGGSSGNGVVFSLTTSGSYSVLKNFAGSDGANPNGSLVQTSDGTLYGMTYQGGSSSKGVVFSLTTSGSYSVLKNFDGITGANPNGSLLKGSDGTLYGMTYQGGSSGYGVVFSLTPSGTYSVLKNFIGADGGYPKGSLMQTSDGTLYGMTFQGGNNGNGVVFSLTTPANTPGTYSVLKYFDGTTGSNPYGNLMQASDGKLYGTTVYGGSSRNGVVFSLTTSGSYSVLKNFTGSDGANPNGSLVQVSDGTLYGMTVGGGRSSKGVLFSLTTSGAYSVLKNFYVNESGSYAYGGLLKGSDGTLYGMTTYGGSYGNGVVFSYNPTSGSYNVLKNFDGITGANPNGSLIQGSDGTLYGMTFQGGNNNNGVVFSLTTSGTYNVLKNFTGSDGANPNGNLMQTSDGTLYGMTVYGGSSGYGVVFSLTTSGSYSVLKNFTSSDGAYPYGNLIQGSDGTLYGMTVNGGSSDNGVVFSLTTSGSYSVLKNFTSSDGANPYGSLMPGSDGKLYGMTVYGGSSGNGVVFSFDPTSGSYGVLKNFDWSTGANPYGNLMQASDGTLYGMTYQGGSNVNGVLFSLTSAGTYAVLKNFDATTGTFPYYEALTEGGTVTTEIGVTGITTSALSTNTYCQGASLQVSYSTTGSFNSSHTFTAQLSDPSGSFTDATPTPIGSISATASGTINATLPANVTPSTGYRIRVVLNSPAVLGSNNGSNITIKAAPSAPTADAQAFCSGQNPTITNVTADGTNLSWYNVSEGGTPLQSTYALSTSGALWVTSTINGCESNRTSVSIEINQTPSAPTVSTQTFCSAGQLTVASLPQNNGNYSWYNQQTGGTALTTATALSTGTYYVAETSNGCESPRSTVSVTINAAPVLVVTNPDPVCAPGTVDLTAAAITAGSTLPQGTTLVYNLLGRRSSSVVNDPTQVGAGTYEIIATSNTCQTSKFVTVTVNPLPIAYTIGGGGTYCSGDNGVDVTLNGSQSGVNYNILLTGNTTPIATLQGTGAALTFQNVTATGTYTIQAVNATTSCSSAMSGSAAVAINPIPTVNAVSNATYCNQDAGTAISFGGTVAGTTFTWTSDANVGFGTSGTGNIDAYTAANSTATPVTATVMVTPHFTNGGVTCDGTAKSFTVKVNPTPTAMASVTSQTICSGTAISSIMLSGTVSNTTYSWTRDNTADVTGIAASGSGDLSGTLSTTATVQKTTQFTITPAANGCTGTAITASVNVNPLTYISTQPSASMKYVAENTFFSVAATGTGTLQYKWQVNTGSGWSDIANGVVYSNANTSTLNLTGVNYAMNGYQYQCVVTGDCGSKTSDAATLTVNKRPVTLAYTGGTSKQYSDELSLSATFSDNSGSSVTQNLSGRLITFTIGSQTATAYTSSAGIASTTLIITQAPGSYTVTVSFDGTNDAVYRSGSNSTSTATVTKEDAFAYFTGSLFVSTSGATSSTATVTLAATIKDITAVNAAIDGLAGDIRNARVKFINRDNGSDLSPWLTPGLVSSTDSKTGTVTFNWTANIGTQNSQSYTVGILVGYPDATGPGYYIRNASDDNSTVTVSKPLPDFITGGGYLILQSSAGQYAGDQNSRSNFGFNVKYNKSGTKLQGNINAILRRTVGGVEHVYQIKGNSMTSLSVNAAISSVHPYPTAVFDGKASIQDITNPLAPQSVDGNASLHVTMTDKGEPGTSDLIALTVWDKNGGLWFSSNWNSTTTVELVLARGNLKVSTNSSFSVTSGTLNASLTTLTSTPNPSVGGQEVTFIATVKPSVSTVTTKPTGSVTFMDGVITLGTTTIGTTNGITTAVFKTTALAAGTRSIKVIYSGDASFSTSTSTALSQVVNTSGVVTLRADLGNDTAIPEGKLTVVVHPNPAPNYFTLVSSSGSDKALMIRVVDGLGRAVEVRTGVPANGTLQIGGNYRPGTYFTQIIQGNDLVNLKLVKTSD